MADKTSNPTRPTEPAGAGQDGARAIADAVSDFGRVAAEAQSKALAEMNRMFSQMKTPAMPDMTMLMSAHKRNMETLSAANRVALEGAQTVARRHMEIMQQTMSELSDTMRQIAAPNAPQEKAAQQAEMLKTSYERAVANMRELSELIQRSNSEAVGLLNTRFMEAVDEVKTIMQQQGMQQQGMQQQGKPGGA